MTAAIAKSRAIFKRDALVALSYPGNFALSWLGLIVEVIVAWYISRLIAPSSKFSPSGAVIGYFQYVAVNTAFVRKLQLAITGATNADSTPGSGGTSLGQGGPAGGNLIAGLGAVVAKLMPK